MNPKESYYAALERQRAGESTIRERFEKSPKHDLNEADVLDTLYTDIGMKAFQAFTNCLEWISRMGSRSSTPMGSEPPGDGMRRELGNQLEELVRETQNVKERIERLETGLASIEAGIRRIDKFTLDAFRSIQELEERYLAKPFPGEAAGDHPPYRGRLPKEEAARLAIDAAHAMRAKGRRLTLAAVAREAGLKYGQIVYAFGNKEGFINALEEVERQSMEAQEKAGA